MKQPTIIRCGRGLRNALRLALCCLALQSAMNPAGAAPFELQGRSAGSVDWIKGNLEGWKELDAVPCRVLISDGPFENQTVTLTFPPPTGPVPGFDELTAFEASPNVQFVQPPVLSSPAKGDWSCSFVISVTSDEPAEVRFLARLAAGSHLNPGNSLMLKGSPQSMGTLQIAKPASALTADPVPKLRIRLTSTNSVVVYWESTATNWQLQENTDCTATGWKNVNEPLLDDGTNRCVVVDPPGANRIYRLVRP